MNYNSESKKDYEEGLSLDKLLIYGKKLLDKWLVIALVAILCASIGFAVAKLNYTPKYSSQIMFIASNKSSAITVAGQSNSDLIASATLAETFKYVFTTTELATKVAASCGYDATPDDIKRCVSVKSVEDTAIVYLTVTTTNPDSAYAIAQAYVDNYQEEIETAIPNTALTVIDPPLKAEKPNANNSMIIYSLLGFIVGFGGTCLVIIAAVIFKDTIKNSDDISSKLGMKVLGTLNRVNRKVKKGEAKQGILITDKKTGFAFIEAYKLIRTKIEHAASRQNYKTIIVTSTLANEGKTTSATNIALSLAQNGKSVLLIDADLRKPSVAKTLGFAATDDEGICGIVSGKKTLKESIKYSEKYQLFVLVSSLAVENSTEILSSPKMEEIIESAKKEFDYVIIDTAPCGIIADASILAAYADTIVLVVKQDFASARRIKRAVDNFENSGTEIIGCIFNHSEGSGRVKFYGKRYGYGYGYGYGSESSKKKKK
ncbi:MAG: polysaccharide biosynthesis tyrosine autokinase [Clostridiaceae bacterium]|nr:polysaccharide biosynthesis tyrosine autokinase [Clostridiaceae bacterium]